MRGVRSFREQPHHRARGSQSEEEARRWLEGRGYTILHRNWQSRLGEIDLVARDGETLCFIEVKARASDRFGPAVAAVTPAKQRRLARIASLFLVEERWRGPCRFDVLGMDAVDGRWQYTLIRGAFEVA